MPLCKSSLDLHSIQVPVLHKGKRPLGGWTIQDCIGLYCTNCKLKLKYVMSDSKVIRRHMNRTHSEDLFKYDAEMKSTMSAEKWVMDNFVMHS